MMTHASGQSSSTSRQYARMCGNSLSVRMIPPGPIVSPLHIRIPYFKAISQSSPRYFTEWSAKLNTTKSAPANTSRACVEASIFSGTPVCATTLSASAFILARWAALVSTSANVPVWRCAECAICQMACRPKKRLPAPINTIFGL